MKRSSYLFAALLLCLNVTATFTRDSYPRSPAVDVVHYRIYLEISEAGEDIIAEAKILIAFLSDGVKEVGLDFAGLTVDQVTENERPANFTRTDARLNIALQENYRRTDRCWLGVKYHGKPKDGLYIKNNKFGHRAVFADDWPNRAHYWFPSIDHPYDKATVEFYVTAPVRYDVVGNGTLMETRSLQNGAKLTHWSEAVPIPAYCMVVGAAEFSIVNAGTFRGAGIAVPVLYYLYPEDRDNGIKDFGRALQMIEFYSSLVGPYPYEKLALVQSSTRFGGMENSSNIFFDEKTINGVGSIEVTVAHEIAHQWFGDSVTEADWHHLWLSEGFATYFSFLFFEHADGRDRFLRLLRASRADYMKAYEKRPGPIYDPGITDLFQLLNRNNYEKAGWLLHMLRHIMGDDRFFTAIRDYYRTYRDRNALTVDLQRILEFHAGRSLDWFFNEWFYEPGYPIYDVTWHWNESTRELELRITQKQDRTVFRMPLDVEIKLGSTTRREVVQMDGRDQTFTFKLDGRPSSLLIDPDEWVLKVLNLAEKA